ncbi:hypothetical protein OH76DRAFT_1200528 [Lentinus brumalis]|uniref:F-box domain-containing protein n=1 Tax=Lentinus brumalis TaxID=2498619 RepID=A0A371CT40_9APHY|nr:hypothetical protein OH76DRAFT_1200528 [Polyporus brumalis]
MFDDCISSQERACLGGLSPAEAQVDENEEINNLHERTCGLRRLYNSAASINAKLPVEILVEIFRLAGPSFGPKEAIRLTHVCHAWRTLIHGTPVYWIDFLFPPPGHFLIGDTMKSASVVLGAITRSAPMRIKMGLYGDFLPALRHPAAEAHLHRITILHLDCRTMDDRDMRPFFDLSLPSLESLVVRMNCFIAIRPKNISAESPARFPRLRSLKTTCTSFPLAWVGAPLRVLEIWAVEEEAATPREVCHLRCCFLRSIPELFKVLGRCPDLEQLRLSGCLPCRGPKWDRDPAVPTPRLDRLAKFEINDDTELTRLFLEYFSPPRETFIAICTDSSYDALSEFLPAKDTLLALPLIQQVVCSACRPEEVYPHTVYGFAEAADGMYRARLAVLSSDKSVLHPWGRREVRDTIDLLRFFRGFAPIFSPAAVVGLDGSQINL